MSGRTSVLALAVAAIVLASVAMPVAADASLSITGVSVPDSVTQGDSFDLTVSVSGEEIQNDQVDVGLTLPEGLSCTPTGSQTVSLSDGTGSATFDCSADVEGDYSGEITASASGSNTNNGNSLSDTTQSGLAVLSPASLTLSTSLDDATVDDGSSTTLTVVVQNSGDAATSYQLSPPSASGYATSLASGSESGTVDAGSTRTVEYTVTGDSAGDYTLTTSLSAGNGQTLAEDDALTVERTATPTPTVTPENNNNDNRDDNDSDDDTPTATQTATATQTVTATQTATATQTTTETAVPTDTATATAATADDTPTDTETATEMGTVTATVSTDSPTDPDTRTTAGTGSGFGVLATVLALLVVVWRRDYRHD